MALRASGPKAKAKGKAAAKAESKVVESSAKKKEAGTAASQAKTFLKRTRAKITPGAASGAIVDAKAKVAKIVVANGKGRGKGPKKQAPAAPAPSSATEGKSASAKLVVPNGKGRGKGLKRPAPDSPAPSSATEGKSASASAHYKVLKSLQLHLQLKTGSVYSADELRARCKGNTAKLSKLENIMLQPEYLEPVAAAASAAQAPAARWSKELKSPPVAASPAQPQSKVLPSAQPATSRGRQPPQRAAKAATGSKKPVSYAAGEIVWFVRWGPWPGKVISAKRVDGVIQTYFLQLVANADASVHTQPVEAYPSELRQYTPGDIKRLQALGPFADGFTQIQSAQAAIGLDSPVTVV